MAGSFGKATGRLSEAVSRRRFVSAIGKAALGLIALGAFTRAPGAALASGTCCTGALCVGDVCPPNTTKGAQIYCCLSGTGYFQCYPCLSIPDNDFVCTVSTYLQSYCPNTPKQ